MRKTTLLHLMKQIAEIEGHMDTFEKKVISDMKRLKVSHNRFRRKINRILDKIAKDYD